MKAGHKLERKWNIFPPGVSLVNDAYRFIFISYFFISAFWYNDHPSRLTVEKRFSYVTNVLPSNPVLSLSFREKKANVLGRSVH